MTPESLLDYEDYVYWITKIKKDSCDNLFLKDEAEFSSLSIHAWTFILMQIVKVLHVARY